MASARFHRPPSGLGISDTAVTHIKSMRMLLGRIDVLECEPNNKLIIERQDNGAYCLEKPGKEISVLFLENKKITLNASSLKGEISINWLNVHECKWSEVEKVVKVDKLELEPPAEGMHVALIQAIDKVK